MEKMSLILSFIFEITGSLAMIVGVATPFWFSDPSQHGGLFTLCYHDDEEGKCEKLDHIRDVSSWEKWVRALILIPCILSVLNIFLIIAHLSRGHDPARNNFRIFCMITLSFISGLLCQVGVIIFFLRHDVSADGNFDASFHLTSIGGYLSVVPIVLYWQVVKGRTYDLGL